MFLLPGGATVLHAKCVQAVRNGPSAGRDRRPGLAGRGPGAVREPVQLTGPAGVRTRHSAQPVHQRRCPRGTDRLPSATGDAAGAVREFLRTESGNPKLDTDWGVARSEAEQGHRNAALAHFIASYGNLQNPVDRVLDLYYAHRAIEASCRDLVLAGLFLSKHGLRVNGRRLLGRTDAKRMNAVMLTCGTNDAAGEFAYRVGLPAKSGVGGGVLAVIPRHGTLCA
jgi:Glutaminase